MTRGTELYQPDEKEQRGRLTEEITNERRKRKLNPINVIAWFGLIVYALFLYGKGGLTVPGKGEMAMYSINVGQADSTFFIFPNGTNLLIDCGEEEGGARVTGVLESLGIDRIDAVILTHPHSDHIGGLITVLKRFDADVVYMPDCECDTDIFKKVIKAVDNAGIATDTLARGDELYGCGCSVSVLSPGDGEYEDENEYSIVLKIEFEDTSYLLMGDADKKIEHELLNEYKDGLSCTVLKVAHHGSATSSSAEFLDAADPDIAVISAEGSPSSDLPNEEVVLRISSLGTKILTTGRDGNIEILSDGENVNIGTSKAKTVNKISKTLDKYIGM